jgi:hypothetical protein
VPHDPHRGLFSRIERSSWGIKFDAEDRLNHPFMTVIAMTLVRKFDQDCDQLTVIKQQYPLAIRTLGSYPQSVG